MSNTADLTHHATACENCATQLQGEFCHACGQSSHNPLRNVGHAIEEVFESFWHLDGRIFRTLRELCFPGRLANRYLAGHRAPYVAPLRLFVILSVLTFFVAQYTLHFDSNREAGDETADVVVNNNFAKADTVDEVIRQRDQAIQGMHEGKAAVAGIPGAAHGFDRGIEGLRKQARERIRQLDPQHPSLQEPEDAPAADASPAPTDAPAAAPPASTDAANNEDEASAGDGFLERWLHKKSQRAEDNLQRFSKEPGLVQKAVLGSIPTALFFLVPIFAMFLKLAYVETRRLYLEHLVVALYSHAWLCLAWLALCVLAGLDAWISPHARWFSIVAGVLEFALWCWMPVYLLLMQKRVYGQAWWLTVLKYLAIGMVYMILVGFASAFVAINTIIS